MGRAPCCDKANVKKGPWSPEEDLKLKEYIEKYGTGGNWIALPQKVGLRRCGKSCRLRWLNYLRPNIKHGEFTDDEDRIIYTLFASIGSRWSIIAAQLPGRTDNDIKNYWNTKLKKKLMGVVPLTPSLPSSSQRKPQQHYQSTTTFSSSPSSTYYHSPSSIVRSFNSGLESLSTTPVPPDLLNSNASTIFQTKESFVSPMQLQDYPQLMKENYVMFGGDQVSCSSSDGSSSNHHMNHGKEMDLEYGTSAEQMGFPGYIFNTGAEENNKQILSNDRNYGLTNEKSNGMWGGSCLEYYGSIEEIKQLLSNTNDGNFTIDEIKTEGERIMYY